MLCTLGHQRASAGERVADPIQRNCWKHPGHSGSHSGDGCCPFHVTGTLWQFLAIFRTRAFCSPATAPWALCSRSISSQSPPIQLIFNFKTCFSAAPFLLPPLSSSAWRLSVLLPPLLPEHCCRMSLICSRTIFIPSFSYSKISLGLPNQVQTLPSGTRSCLNLPWVHLCSPDLIISKQKHLSSSLCFCSHFTLA